MTQTSYKAWDGNLYEWPPPEGWYQAEDGRWWPNGYGPQADAADSQIGETDAVAGESDVFASESDVLVSESQDPTGESEVDLGPAPTDWPYPGAAAETVEENLADVPAADGSFPPVEPPKSGSLLGETLPPSDYNPSAEVSPPEESISFDESDTEATSGSLFTEPATSEAEPGEIGAPNRNQGPASFPPPPVGSAQVFSGPDQPDPRSPFEKAIADDAEGDAGLLPPPNIGDSLYPADLATSQLPASPTFDDGETIAGELPLDQIPTGTPPSLANPAFSEVPGAPGGLPSASGQPWDVSAGGEGVAGMTGPAPAAGLPSAEDLGASASERRSDSGRDRTILFLLIGLVLVAAALYAGSQLLSGDDDEDDEAAAAATVAADAEGTGSDTETDSTEDAAPENDDASAAAPSGSPDPSAAEGTFANPHRRNFEVDINYSTEDGDRSWRIAVQEPVVEAEDAGTPATGNAFAVANVLVRNQQADTELPVNTLQFNVATESGDVVRWADAACTSGDPLDVDAVLADGEEVQGALCWEVPAESLDSLLLRVETDDVSGEVFIELN